MQTFQPDHPAIAAAARHDFLRFAEHELELRQVQKYPPFGVMARVVVRGKDEKIAGEAAQQIGRQLREADEAQDVRILGPAPAPLMRLRGEYRFHLQLQAAEMEVLHGLLRPAIKKFRLAPGVKWTVDMDPWDMQ